MEDAKKDDMIIATKGCLVSSKRQIVTVAGNHESGRNSYSPKGALGPGQSVSFRAEVPAGRLMEIVVPNVATYQMIFSFMEFKIDDVEQIVEGEEISVDGLNKALLQRAHIEVSKTISGRIKNRTVGATGDAITLVPMFELLIETNDRSPVPLAHR
jgi:hypothetical protein